MNEGLHEDEPSYHRGLETGLGDGQGLGPDEVEVKPDMWQNTSSISVILITMAVFTEATLSRRQLKNVTKKQAAAAVKAKVVERSRLALERAMTKGTLTKSQKITMKTHRRFDLN